MRLYNTEKRAQEKIAGDKLTMYTCGPTVYNFAHIGNFRTYVFEDLLRRSLKYFGFQVRQAMNLTDVDDKTIRGALEKGVSLNEFTQSYKDAFFSDIEALGIERVEEYPAATDYIDQMINLIEKLIEKGFAYKLDDGNVFYRIDAFPSYGRLSHLKIEDLKVGASDRVEDEYDKESACDFVLWKAYDKSRDGDIFWESPFGRGRPGWHIECSAMAMHLLGETIDIHVGGVDNMFPHHENEIAQSEACSGRPFVKHWLHAEHLIVDGKKMSKSLGNFYTLRDLLQKGYTGREVRYMLLSTHYRTQLNFTLEGLNGARQALDRLDSLIRRLQSAAGEGSFDTTTTRKQFNAGLEDDLNISVSLAALFDMVREVNTLIDANKLSPQGAQQVLDLLNEFNVVLNVFLFEEEGAPPELQEALEKRNAARAAKDWATADRYRDEIQAAGYTIEDSKSGSRLVKSSK
ncbi:MAG: cysteine--tRNA ligase [Simkaniaceae bacterium]|nr:cysteine--tRNA ligase [Simkaniaceae bacterium]